MFEALLEKIDTGKISELTHAHTELKSDWAQDAGRRISAIANELTDGEIGFLIVGVTDSGHLLQTDINWLKATEQQASSHVRQYLMPTHAVKLQGHRSADGHHVLLIRIESPGDITLWNHKAYKRVGTQTQEMTSDERLNLSLRLPGQDYSKYPFHGNTSGSLIVQFAQKLVEKDHPGLPKNLDNIAPVEIL